MFGSQIGGQAFEECLTQGLAIISALIFETCHMERSGEANWGRNLVVVLIFVTSLTRWGDSANSGAVVHHIRVALFIRVQHSGMAEAGLSTLAVCVSERTGHSRVQRHFACNETSREKRKSY